MISIKEAANIFYHHFDRYKEHTLKHKRIKHSDIVPLIQKLLSNNWFVINQIGQSVQGRDIFLIAAGHGSNKIFMWSQMHGCLLYTSPSPRDRTRSRMPSSA